MAEALWERVSEAPPTSSSGALVGVQSVVLEAFPEGALWWADTRMLVVADLHLEKGSSFARRGQLIPPYDTFETLSALARLIARLQPLPVTMDSVARVVINERTGTVVLGGDVRLGPAAVAHGNISVRIATQLNVSQPAPLSQGQTTVVPQTEVNVDEAEARLITLEPGATLSDVVRALNLLGVTPRDIIAVMQALKAAGALRAELVIL